MSRKVIGHRGGCVLLLSLIAFSTNVFMTSPPMRCRRKEDRGMPQSCKGSIGRTEAVNTN